MFQTYLTGWQSMTAAYFADAASLLGGNINALSVTAAAGIVLLLAGILVAVAQKVTRTRRLIIPAILTILWPIFILWIENTIAWMGRIFLSIFGVGALLIWIGLIVGKAPQKTAIWLVGLGLVCFVGYFGLVTLVPLLL
jgi:hypothetical protein